MWLYNEPIFKRHVEQSPYGFDLIKIKKHNFGINLRLQFPF